MKKLVFLLAITISQTLMAQNVGIGTPTPLQKLHVQGTTFLNGNVGIGISNPIASIDVIRGTGVNGTAAFHGSTHISHFNFGTEEDTYIRAGKNNRNVILNDILGGLVGIGTSTPLQKLHVEGATYLNGNVGIGTATPLQKLHVQGTTFLNGIVGIGTNPFYTLDVTGNLFITGNFVNTSTSGGVGVLGSCSNSSELGTGVYGLGSRTGVFGVANVAGTGERFGLLATAANGSINFGVYGSGYGGATAYGIYAHASDAAFNWAGYFSGSVYATDTYSSSDRKLKNEIRPLSGALSIINQLNPSFYTFKTTEYKQMHLPEGIHYGLIADEVQMVMPGAVKKAIQPAQYENHNEQRGKKLSDEVEFNAVNYTEMIPILIGAVKEQQVIINSQQKQIDELKKLVEQLINK